MRETETPQRGYRELKCANDLGKLSEALVRYNN